MFKTLLSFGCIPTETHTSDELCKIFALKYSEGSYMDFLQGKTNVRNFFPVSELV